MLPDHTFKHGTFLDGLWDAACLPVEYGLFVYRSVSWRDFWRDWLLTTMVFAVLAIFDPIGVASNSALSSEQLFYRIISPSYPQASEDPKSNSPFDDITEIAVIVIDDQSLKDFREPWPPPFSIHEKILKKVLTESTPKAVFIDFGFFDLRDPDEVGILASTLGEHALPNRSFPRSARLWRETAASTEDATARGKIPVFLAGAPGPLDPENDRYRLEVIPRLKNAVTGTVSTREADNGSYVLYDCDMDRPSAALALYGTDRDDWTRWNLDDCQTGWRSAGGPNMLSIFWATWGDETRSRGSYACKSLPGGVTERILQVLIAPLLDLLGVETWSNKFQACPPHRAVSAQQFLADETGVMSAFIEDRYVFYGGNFVMADDLIVPPTHKPVPGVFLHAMALDNLLRLDPYIRQATGSGLKDRSLWLTLVTAALMSLSIALAWNPGQGSSNPGLGSGRPAPASQCSNPDCAAARAEEESGPERRLGMRLMWRAGWLALSVSVVLLAIVVSFFWFHWAPANFIGLFSFLGLHTAYTGFREFLSGIF